MNIRVNRKRYTTLNNTPVIDSNLSAVSLGIYTYIMSKPDNWSAHKNEIYKRFAGATVKTSKNLIDNAFRELVASGYIVVTTPRTVLDNGQVRFNGKEYVFHEEPQTFSKDDNLGESRNPDIGDSRCTKEVAHIDNIDLITNTNKNIVKPDLIEREIKDFPPSLEIEDIEVDIKKPAPKRKKKPTINLIWPASFTPNVINLLTEYMEMRKQIGKAMTSQLAFTKMVNACEKIAIDYGGEAVLIHSINSAIAAQWLSIYPKPLNKPTNHTNNGNQPNNLHIADRDLFDKLLTIKCTLQNLRIYPKHLDSLEGEEKLKAMQMILETHKNKQNAI
ncbi:MAG TPA: hypothetical protein VMW53_07190 [archaeon]|nr:hypothetical protein [archaeon]